MAELHVRGHVEAGSPVDSSAKSAPGQALKAKVFQKIGANPPVEWVGKLRVFLLANTNSVRTITNETINKRDGYARKED